MNPNYYATEIDTDIDSDAAEGPKKNANWWNGMKGSIETQLIQGLINELEPKLIENKGSNVNSKQRSSSAKAQNRRLYSSRSSSDRNYSSRKQRGDMRS